MNDKNGCGFLIAIVFGLALVSSAIQSCNPNSGGGSNYTPTTSNNSFEHRYVKERVKLEGYSDSEAQQAADAIIKFHEAQKRR